jgi:hypothetical protein
MPNPVIPAAFWVIILAALALAVAGFGFLIVHSVLASAYWSRRTKESGEAARHLVDSL